jgi:hypothetical protein
MPDVMKVAVAETSRCDGELRVNLRFGRHRQESIGIVDGSQGTLM